MSDDLLFVQEEEFDPKAVLISPFWPILIVDDEPEVFGITQLALEEFLFQGAPLELNYAQSASIARQMLDEREYAVVLCDMIMEEDSAGMWVIEHIRKRHENLHTRIILRSGQPGILNLEECYMADINEFVSKTELTNTKLKQLMRRHLRDYAISAWYLERLALKDAQLAALKRHLEESA